MLWSFAHVLQRFAYHSRWHLRQQLHPFWKVRSVASLGNSQLFEARKHRGPSPFKKYTGFRKCLPTLVIQPPYSRTARKPETSFHPLQTFATQADASNDNLHMRCFSYLSLIKILFSQPCFLIYQVSVSPIGFQSSKAPLLVAFLFNPIPFKHCPFFILFYSNGEGLFPFLI